MIRLRPEAVGNAKLKKLLGSKIIV